MKRVYGRPHVFAGSFDRVNSSAQICFSRRRNRADIRLSLEDSEFAHGRLPHASAGLDAKNQAEENRQHTAYGYHSHWRPHLFLKFISALEPQKTLNYAVRPGLRQS